MYVNSDNRVFVLSALLDLRFIFHTFYMRFVCSSVNAKSEIVEKVRTVLVSDLFDGGPDRPRHPFFDRPMEPRDIAAIKVILGTGSASFANKSELLK